MYNAISKYAVAIALSLAFAACADKDKEGAMELYTHSEAAVQAENYDGALALLDTLNARYPKQTDIRRDAMRLRALAMEGIARRNIGTADAELAAATLNVQEWAPKFRHVDSSVGLEGYFLPKGVDEKVMTASGIQARVSDKGFFYIVANVQGRSIGLKSIELIAGADRVSSAEISPARIIKVEGSESASFNPEELEAIGPWLTAHPHPSMLVLVGSKGSVNVKLSARQADELLDCYHYSEALQAQRKASINREKYERMLATSRDQLANMPAKTDE